MIPRLIVVMKKWLIRTNLDNHCEG